ncbi:MAG: sialate O-acetylesterase [Clostridia bacterium]|nr:sialate O-acetylesterase [Clostridia bacterium]
MLKNFYSDTFDIIIQAGQSNAQGCGFGPVNDPFVPAETIWAMAPDLTVAQARESASGNRVIGNFALNFANLYVKNGFLAPGRKVLILLSALGGTGFSDGRWKAGDDLHERLLQMTGAAMALNPANRAAAFLWHQGETDAILGASRSYYERHFAALIKAVRSACRDDRLPFIAGDFVWDWKKRNMDLCEPVISALRSRCSADGRGRFVETNGLKSNAEENRGWEAVDPEEAIHFSRRSLYLLGERYFKAYKAAASRS